MTSPSKIKGNSWENEIAKHLSALYETSFIKTPGSGAYVGGKNATRREFLHEGQVRMMKGDIVPPLEWRYLNAEAKFYKDFAWHQLYTGSNKTLDGWISQLYDASEPDDVNVLFLKFNRQGKFVGIEDSIFNQLSDISCYMKYKSIAHGNTFVIVNYQQFFDTSASVFKHKCMHGTNSEPRPD